MSNSLVLAFVQHCMNSMEPEDARIWFSFGFPIEHNSWTMGTVFWCVCVCAFRRDSNCLRRWVWLNYSRSNITGVGQGVYVNIDLKGGRPLIASRDRQYTGHWSMFLLGCQTEGFLLPSQRPLPRLFLWLLVFGGPTHDLFRIGGLGFAAEKVQPRCYN